MKHTPGPWKYWKGRILAISERTQFTKIGVRAFRAEICNIDYEADLPIETTDANALLISAAPDLLEALKTICTYPAEDNLVLRTAKEAIAKAEGREA